MIVTALDKLKRTGFEWLERGIGEVVAARLAVAARLSQDRLWGSRYYDEAPPSVKYLALSQLVSRSLPPEAPLSAHELSVFSQNGEDGVLFELRRRMVDIPHSFVEFGIGRGSQGNCVLLADVFGWSGLFVEYDRDSYGQLRTKYGGSRAVRTACERVTPQNVESVFGQAQVPTEFGILSIDIDGNDYWVWEALEDYRPAIVVIEYNSMLPLDEALAQPYDSADAELTSFSGASLGALEGLAKAKGYELVHTDLAGVNAFFVLAELAGAFPQGPDLRHGINYYLMSSVFSHPASPRTDWARPQAGMRPADEPPSCVPPTGA